MRCDIGVNAETAYCQIAADELGMKIEDVFYQAAHRSGLFYHDSGFVDQPVGERICHQECGQAAETRKFSKLRQSLRAKLRGEVSPRPFRG